MIPALRALGVATTSYQLIHAAFASGFVPVVSGARALEALEAYAHVMCGGRQVVVEVTSAIADVQDLFGKLEAWDLRSTPRRDDRHHQSGAGE